MVWVLMTPGPMVRGLMVRGLMMEGLMFLGAFIEEFYISLSALEEAAIRFATQTRRG